MKPIDKCIVSDDIFDTSQDGVATRRGLGLTGVASFTEEPLLPPVD